MPHDGAGWRVAGDGFESGTREGGDVTGAGGAWGFGCIQRIGFERGRVGTLCGFERCGDECRRDSSFAIADADIEAGQRPDAGRPLV